jgi:hypothetical protein
MRAITATGGPAHAPEPPVEIVEPCLSDIDRERLHRGRQARSRSSRAAWGATARMNGRGTGHRGAPPSTPQGETPTAAAVR